MSITSFLSRLLAVLAMAGLLAVPAVAGRTTVKSSLIHAAMTEMTSMPDGMPCCPHQKQSVPDCQKNCPFAALCAAQWVPAIPAEANFLLRRLKLAEPMSPFDDGQGDQHFQAPPQRPPLI